MAKLGDIFNLQMGKTPSRANKDYWDNGNNSWVSISDLSTYDKYVGNTKEKITDLAVQESGIKLVPPETVIMSFKLSVGKTAITSSEVYTNEAIMAFIPTGKYDICTDYFFYFLSYKDWSVGSDRAVMGATLNKTTLNEFKIIVPSISEQRRIASILDKVTDLIAKRRAQLEKLDLLVKSRFVEMFGDPETNAKKWDVLPLSEICSIGSSKRIYQSELCVNGIPFLRVSDLINLIKDDVITAKLYITEEKYQEFENQGYIPSAGDILVTSRGTLGQCYIIKENDRFYFQDGMISWLFNYKNNITPIYISHLFSMPGFRKQIDCMQAGSTVSYLSIDMLKRLNVMVPDIEIQKEFCKIVYQVEQSKNSISCGLEKLVILKKSLMQKYFERGV